MGRFGQVVEDGHNFQKRGEPERKRPGLDTQPRVLRNPERRVEKQRTMRVANLA